MDPAEDADRQAFLSTSPAGRRARRLTVMVAVLSSVGFVAAVPLAPVQLAKIPAFIPSYESALVIIDLITAVLLFGQFTQLRSRALLAIASGYLFDALIIIPHALTFPGAFSATGLLGAGPQTTAWLYVFWHGGFGLFALAYALFATLGDAAGPMTVRPGVAIAYAIGGVAAGVVAFALAATLGHDYLPVIIHGGDFRYLVTKGISPTVMAVTFLALVVLWRRRRPVVLDQWVMMVLCAWLYDVALSAAIASSRYDLGWYAGRSYGLLAASFVLVALLIETNGLQRRLAAANIALWDQSRGLADRVRERTGELARSNEALARAQRIAGVGSSEHDLVSGVITWSEEHFRIFGVDRNSFRPNVSDIRAVIHPEDRTKYIAMGEKLQSGIPQPPLRYRIIRPDGQMRWLHREHGTIKDEQGSPIRIVITVKDVTEQLELERQLNHSQKLEALGTLASGIAHDLNNALVPIVALSRLALQEVTDNTSMREDLEAVAIGGERARDLVRRILAFARKQDLVKKPTDLAALLRDAMRLLRASLPASIELVERLTEVRAIMADGGQLHQVVVNLVTNAAQAIGDHTGRIVVTLAPASAFTEAGSQFIRVSVTDTGCGMDDSKLSRIFEPFYTTKPAGEGTGLGLSVVHGIVIGHGGTIDVRSRPGEGTEFAVLLPVWDEGDVPSAVHRSEVTVREKIRC